MNAFNTAFRPKAFLQSQARHRRKAMKNDRKAQHEQSCEFSP